MSEDFVKHFTVEGSTSILPDAAYWLSREELILTYLHQRNANVPKVSIKNLTQKSIAMENVGQSLSIQLKENKNHFNTVQVAILITNSIEALIEIFNLGILHLDIALRNIATPQGANNRIYILDFVHCLSATNRLQKPLPLLPTDGLHHPMLYQALKKDWNNYFFSINQTQPVLDQTLTLSNEEFSEYWSDSISVQNLSNQLAILCHGIGNLLEEASWLPSASDAHKSIYREQSKKLKNLSEDEAQHALNQVLTQLNKLTLGAPPDKSSLDLSTPIPTVRHYGRSFNEKPQKKTGSIIARIRESSLKLTAWRSLNTKYIQLIWWTFLILNASWINLVVEAGNIKLPNWLLSLVLINFIITPIAIGLLLILKNKFSSAAVTTAFNFLVLTEFLLINSYPPRVMSTIVLWMPSTFILIFILITYNNFSFKFLPKNNSS